MFFLKFYKLTSFLHGRNHLSPAIQKQLSSLAGLSSSSTIEDKTQIIKKIDSQGINNKPKKNHSILMYLITIILAILILCALGFLAVHFIIL